MNNFSRALFVGAAACCAQAVSAQSLSDQVRGCAAQAETGARLACYDQLAASLGKGAAVSGAAVSPPSPDAQFGIAGGKLEQKKEGAVPKDIQALVSGVARRPRGELVITLDNGQVWAQLAPQEYYPLKIGDTVHISKGALGSYSLTTPAKRGSKVTRLL